MFRNLFCGINLVIIFATSITNNASSEATHAQQMVTTQITKSLANLLAKGNYADKTFTEPFNQIIASQIEGYNGNTKEKLKSFFEDLQHGGCISGMVGEFIYHSDCKKFYIDHIDDLEEMRTELESEIGEPIKNRHEAPHYTFMCWLCFEELRYLNSQLSPPLQGMPQVQAGS